METEKDVTLIMPPVRFLTVGNLTKLPYRSHRADQRARNFKRPRTLSLGPPPGGKSASPGGRALKVAVNGAVVGDLLTTIGSTLAQDRQIVTEAGYECEYEF